MCLYKSNKKGNKAKEDIVCYKILSFDGTKYYTPYQGLFVTNEEINGEKPLVAIGEKNIIQQYCTEFDSEYKIEGGFIHTFGTLEDAKKELNELINQYIIRRQFSYPGLTRAQASERFCMFKCIIPKNVLYHKGCCDILHRYDSYASTSIQFIEKLS